MLKHCGTMMGTNIDFKQKQSVQLNDELIVSKANDMLPLDTGSTIEFYEGILPTGYFNGDNNDHLLSIYYILGF